MKGTLQLKNIECYSFKVLYANINVMLKKSIFGKKISFINIIIIRPFIIPLHVNEGTWNVFSFYWWNKTKMIKSFNLISVLYMEYKS